MNMVKLVFREESPLIVSSFRSKLQNLFYSNSSSDTVDTEIERLIKCLRIRGMIKYGVDETDNEQDRLLSAKEEIRTIRFVFVGIILFREHIIIVLPKYYPKYFEENNTFRIHEIVPLMKTIMKYKQSRLDFTDTLSSSLSDDDSGSLLSTMLYLMEDYFEHGVYANEEFIESVNTVGEILWTRTVSKYSPTVVDNQPYYMELISRKRFMNDKLLISRIHAAIVSDCSKCLSDYGILEIFDYSEADPSDNALEDIGDTGFLLSAIEYENNKQFNTRKRYLLHLMKNYLNKESLKNAEKEFYFFGTNSMNLVWQDVCSETLGNFYMDNEFDEIRENFKMHWRFKESEDPSQKGLEPDIIHIEKNENDEVSSLSILDAKYYTPELNNGKLEKAPGVPDVAKQYLYRIGFNDYVKNRNIKRIFNAFLFPGFSNPDESVFFKNGRCTIPLFEERIIGKSYEPVFYIFIDTASAFEHYLRNEQIEFEELIDKLR